jgi:hypothetical protein
LASIYQGTCRNCGHKSSTLSDPSLALLINPDHPALQIPLNQCLVSRDVGELAATENLCLLILAHPGEDHILRSAGTTLSDASNQGRLVRLQAVVCRACGTVHDRRRLIAAPNPVGCVVGVASFAAVSALIGWSTRHAGVAFVVGYATLMGVVTFAELLAKMRLRRFRTRANALARPGTCPNCNSPSARRISIFRTVPCPSCGQRSMRFKPVGIS